MTEIRPLDSGKMVPSIATMFHTSVSLGLRIFARFAWRVDMRRAAGARYDDRVCLYASNHRSFLDPPLVGMWNRRACSYFARRSLWKLPVIRQVLQMVDGIPVDRDAPGTASIRDAVATLKGGRSLVIFPEGTRTKTGQLGTFRDGPAMIARRAGVPVVPVYVHNTERGWSRGWPLPNLDAPGIAVRFGRPVRPPSELNGRQQDAWLTAYLLHWMRSQEAAMQGTAVAADHS